MKYKYTEKDALRFGWKGIEGCSYSEKSDFARASAAVFDVVERHGKVKSRTSDRIYFVLEGAGRFEIAGEVIDVAATDVVIVPRETEYDYSGKMRLFLVHTPAYDRETEVILDNTQDA